MRKEKRGIRRFSVIAIFYLIVSSSVATAAVGVIRGHPVLPGLVASTASPITGSAKYLVLIVLDGARPDYFGLTSLPNMDRLSATGTQYTTAFDGILESETPTGHTTIATGSTPARNGILGFDWGQDNKDYSIFDPNVVNAGAMEHIMAAAKVPTIAGLYKAKNPHATVVALSGHKYYAADPMGGPQADAIMYFEGDTKGRYVPVAVPGHVPPSGVFSAPGLTYPTIKLPPGIDDTMASRLAVSAIKVMRPHVLMINYPEFDWPLGHVFGGSEDPQHVVELMKNFDQGLGMIEAAYRKQGVLDQTLFLITADHGMAPVSRFVPENVITNAVSKAGTTAPAISYSTGAYIWLTDSSKASTVAANIVSAADPGIQSVYYLGTSHGQPTYQLAGGTFVNGQADLANRYLLQTLVNGHEPAVVAFAKEGQTFTNPTYRWKADHGGAAWISQRIPLIISGPGIRRGYIDGNPAQLEDIAPTVLADMGVRPTGMQGQILTDSLLQAGSADIAARNAEIATITPIVKGLTAQDTFETSFH
jgi:predicted AlkP superfamily pyrophosphatase or phosphodiesterase